MSHQCVIQVAHLEEVAASAGSAAQRTIASMQDQLHISKAEVQNLQQALQACRAEAQELQLEYSQSLGAAAGKAQQACQQQLQGLEGRVEGMQGRVVAAEQEQHAAQAAVVRLQDQVRRTCICVGCVFRPSLLISACR